MNKLFRLGAMLAVLSFAWPAFPCDVIVVRGPGDPVYKPPTAEDYVRLSDAILRVRAKGYALIPPGSGMGVNCEPTTLVSFDLLEVLKGSSIGAEITLPGWLVDRDEFNTGSVPYTMNRSGGCFADVYKSGGEFLLLVRLVSGEYTARWESMAPLNEQVRGSDDAWLLWVRAQLR